MSNGTVVIGWRKRWNRNLLRFLRSRASRADIEDLAQETYLRLLRAPDLREVHNPEAYLIRVASHVASDWAERQLRPDAVVEVEADMLIDGATPDFEVEARLSQLRVDDILKSFSPMMRAVVLLKLRDDRGNNEIARELGLTSRQVKRLLARGYYVLREALE